MKHFCFHFILEEIKYSCNLAASSDFTVTDKGMIISTGNYTFPVAVMTVL